MKSVPARLLLGAGAGAFVLAIGLYVVYGVIHPASWTLDPVDLADYRSGGLIVRGVRPIEEDLHQKAATLGDLRRAEHRSIHRLGVRWCRRVMPKMEAAMIRTRTVMAPFPAFRTHRS